jgi:hypothetical protein
MAGSCPWAWFVPADDVGCEPGLCAWIVHPAETWSNIAFFAVGGILLIRYRRTDRLLPVAWMPWIVIAIGVGSFAFHASMIRWLLVADVAAIFLLTAFLLAAYLQHAGLVGSSRLPMSFLALLAAGVALAAVDPRLGYAGVATQGLAIVYLAWLLPVRGQSLDLVGAIAFNQLAAVTLWLDKGRVACVGGAFAHVVQPHSFWHILSALSLFFVYRYEREVEHSLATTRGTAV